MAEQLLTALLRLKAVQALTGDARSTLYEKKKAGLLTQPIAIGARAKAWPGHEIVAINRARIAGATDDEIRKLVEALHAARKSATPSI